MICSRCGKKSNNIKVINGVEYCHSCGQFSEAGGTTTDGLLTRNRFSIRRDSKQYEADLLPPHEYDRASRKIKPSEKFIKQYPHRIKETYTKEELKEIGIE